LSTQVLTPQALDAWIGLLRGHAALTRRLNADLIAEHGMTINDYDVLVHLARAPGQQMRRVDLAQSVLLTASGITRLLDGLEREGWVEKRHCTTDARVTYAALTDTGLAKLKAARCTHLQGVRELFADRFTCDEITQLGTLLGRLSDPGTDGSC
jgi:DNA-binding MarR family transcriptional regulator